jgi:hypothetical protein
VLRVVLGVALAVALVAAATPALEDARTDRTERLAERELGRVGTAAESLAREEAPGARRTLTLSLPIDSPTAAPVAYVALGGLPADESAVEESAVEESAVTDTAERDVLAVRVAGGRRHIRRVGVDLRVVRDGTRSTADSRALVLRDGGTHEVTLRLVRLGGHRVVVVSIR